MVTIAIFNSIVVILAYIARYKNYNFFLKISFFLIFIFLALRYDYGNDYPIYLNGFLELNRYVFIDYSDKSLYFEPGWVFLCRLFKPLGFFAMITVLSAFNCLVYYSLIKKYVPPSYYWFAVFLYVYDPGFMLVHSSAMRQSLAICIFILSIEYIYNKNLISYLLCIFLASTFHSSAMILLPVYLIGAFDWKINKLVAILFIATYLFLFQFGQSLIPYINKLISNNFDRYETYEGDSELGLRFIYTTILFLLVLLYEPFQDKKFSILFKIAVLSFFIHPLKLVYMMIGRIGMYFDPTLICVLPAIIISMKNNYIKSFTLLCIPLLTLYIFYGFFQSEIWKTAFSSYRTIISSPYIY
jgi:hypothetical protein